MTVKTARVWDGTRIVRLLLIALLGTLVIFLLLTVPGWLKSWYQGSLPGWVRRRIVRVFLQSLLASYVLGWVALCVALTLAVRRARRALRQREARPMWVARTLAVCAVFAVAAIGLETTSAAYAAWQRRIPRPPKIPPGTEFVPTRADHLGKSNDRSLYLVVLGESSARGEPYHPWLSIGQILGWELERVFPGRKIEVDIRAYGGAPLAPNQRILFEELTRRPDAVLIYSGHNEFYNRWLWSSTLPHYDDERVIRSLTPFLEALGKATPLCRLIRDTIDRHDLAIPPPPLVNRELIDRPICSAEQTAQLVDEFRVRLESMVSYCVRIGAVPILVIPAGSDGGFDPTRSYLSARTLEAERASFARDFLAVRALESTQPSEAIAAYGRLLDRQPGFAEAHFRVARLLEASGDTRSANFHYIHAREQDGMPMRCPNVIQEVYRAVAARHNAVLVDGPAVLSGMSDTGIIDNRLIHDAQHPTLVGYSALAQVALDLLEARKEFGWPAGVPSPEVDPAFCAGKAGLDAERWGLVCKRTSRFFDLLAPLRYDPEERLRLRDRWIAARTAVETGADPDQVGMPGLGTQTNGLRPLDRNRFRATGNRRKALERDERK
jgi:hypothetical protein